MDPYHHNHTPPQQQGMPTTTTLAPLTCTGATSNYVVQLDPNSGHFEIIDSSLATIPSNQGNESISLSGSTEGEEAVYKIRDEDFNYLRGPMSDQPFADLVDIDPVMDPMVNDIFALSRNLQFIQPQIQQAQLEGVQQFQMQMQIPTVQSNNVQQMQYVTQAQNQQQYYLTMDGFGGLSTDNYQIAQQQAAPVNTTSADQGQISAAVMSIVSSLITPGATALHMDNNILICNPGGQIIQIPLQQDEISASSIQFQTLPGGSMNTSTESSEEVHYQIISQQASSAPPQQLQQQVVIPSSSSSLVNAQQLQTSAYNIHESPLQQQQQYFASAPVTINEMSQVTAVKSVPQYVEIDECESIQQQFSDSFMNLINQQTYEKQVNRQNQVSVITSAPSAKVSQLPQVEIKKPEESCDTVDSAPSSIPTNFAIETKVQNTIDIDIEKIINKPETFSTTEVEDEDDEDEFDIKIVSCYSQAHPKDESDNSKFEDSTKPNIDLISTKTKALLEENIEKSPSDDLLEDKESSTAPGSPQSKSSDVVEVEEQEPPLKRLKLEEIVEEVTSRTPNIPLWLESYVDKDDELLIAFQNRFDPMATDICMFCYSWFYSEEELDSHIKDAHIGKENTHSCTICGARFIARVLKLRHEKLHKYDLKYRHIVYKRYPNLRNHYKRRYRPVRFSEWYESHVTQLCNLVEELPFDCFECGASFSSSDFVQEHYNRFHALQQCGFCGTVCSDFNSLTTHEQEIHGNYAVTCNYEGGAWNLWDHWQCEESLKKDVLLSNIAYFHNYTKTDPEAPKVIEEDFIDCFDEVQEVNDDTECQYISTINEETIEELNASEEANADTFIFSAANDEELSESGQIHPRLPFACTQCQKSYDNEHDLKRHARCHMSPSKANLACQFCGRNFKTHSHKKEHERTHTGEKPYSCSICQRSFIQSSNLKKHIQTHQQSSLQCGICGKQFIKEASLILHQRAHAQDRKFRCAICDRAYNYASLLKRHMRIHTGEMPYSCESCGMLFHELVSLHYHRKKVHTGERPHKCDTCGRAFILSSDLKKHIQIHLKPQTEKQPILKPMRKRSQSKSTEKSDNPGAHSPLSPIISSAVSISTPERTSTSDYNATKYPEEFEHITKNYSGKDKSDSEDDEVLMLSPSPSSSLENEIMSNKPPVVRVYARRSPKFLSSSFSKEPMEVDSSFTQNSSVQFPSTSNSFRTNLFKSLVSTQEEAEMLLGIHEERVDYPNQNQTDSTGFAQVVANSETLQKNILEDVLQLSGITSFPDFDISNIIVVPESTSEIEVIMDDKSCR